jgi:O-antigen/teichoic acid export membrane protein
MARNVLSSWGGHVVFVIAGFIMPRLIDDRLGQVSLGLWDFAWSMVSYFGLAQVGVGSSVNRYVAKYRAANDVESLNRTVSSVNVIQMFSTLLALAITASLMWLLPTLFGARIGIEANTARWMIGLLGSAVAAGLAFNAFGGVLTGCHRWDIHNAVNAGTYAVITSGMIAALVFGGGLRAISAVYLAGTLGGELVRMRLAFRVCPELNVSPRLATWSDIRTLLVFGGKTVVDNLSRLLLTQANSILVASYLGPAALAVYARPGALVRHADTLTNKFGMVLAPAASSLKGSQRFDELKQLFIDATRYAAFLAVPITVFLAVMGDPILQVWMGPAYRQGALMAVMSLGTLLPLTMRPAGHVLIGLNAHGRVGWASFGVAWLGVAAVVISLGPLKLGLVGAALSLVIPYTLGNGLFVMIYTCRKVGIPLGEFCRKAYLTPLALGLALAAGLSVVRIVFPDRPLVSLLAGMMTGAVIVGPTLWRFALPEHLRMKVRRKIGVGRNRAPAISSQPLS